MISEEAVIGLRVRVSEEYRVQHLRGSRGTVMHRWGSPNYLALDVLLEDGSQQLFWHHELERVDDDGGGIRQPGRRRGGP
jgi:hypothetical protein